MHPRSCADHHIQHSFAFGHQQLARSHHEINEIHTIFWKEFDDYVFQSHSIKSINKESHKTAEEHQMYHWEDNRLGSFKGQV
jgi:hypothetical protein